MRLSLKWKRDDHRLRFAAWYQMGDIDMESLLYNVGQMPCCDRMKDLSRLREQYREKIGSDADERAIDIKAQQRHDDLRALRVTSGYYALPWYDRMFYQPLDQFVAALGLVTATWKGGKAAANAPTKNGHHSTSSDRGRVISVLSRLSLPVVT